MAFDTLRGWVELKIGNRWNGVMNIGSIVHGDYFFFSYMFSSNKEISHPTRSSLANIIPSREFLNCHPELKDGTSNWYSWGDLSRINWDVCINVSTYRVDVFGQNPESPDLFDVYIGEGSFDGLPRIDREELFQKRSIIRNGKKYVTKIGNPLCVRNPSGWLLVIKYMEALAMNYKSELIRLVWDME